MSELKIVDTNKLLDMNEAASLLNIKKSTLYSLCMKRQVSCVKIGKLNRFRRQDLDKWIESKIQGEA